MIDFLLRRGAVGWGFSRRCGLPLERLHFDLSFRHFLQAAGQPLGIHSFFNRLHRRQGRKSSIDLLRFVGGSASSAEAFSS